MLECARTKYAKDKDNKKKKEKKNTKNTVALDSMKRMVAINKKIF